MDSTSGSSASMISKHDVSSSDSEMGPSHSEDEFLLDDSLSYQLDLLKYKDPTQETEQFTLAPIFTGRVLSLSEKRFPSEPSSKISQFGLLAGLRNMLNSSESGPGAGFMGKDPRVLFNVSSPSSTFICGSQGSGKSHTLSCILESCLIPSRAGRLPDPLTGLVFHYDTFIGDRGGSPCEAAFLSSHPDVKVRVLCSPTNLHTMKQTYSRFNIEVDPLRIDQRDLNTKRMLDLMAINQDDGPMPLYMHTVKRILREMRIKQQEFCSRFDYLGFKQRVQMSGLTPAQTEPLNQRLDMLESFMPPTQVNIFGTKGKKSLATKTGTDWEPVAGRLTIVDLSCPCISPETACSLFNICLGIFLEQNPRIGRVVALDEAHKYMNSSAEAHAFTDTLLSTVRLQRHLGARIVISTQEPTISTDLLNLCSVTIVHRFSSPEWLRILQHHVAAAADSPFSVKENSAKKKISQSQENGDAEESSATSLFKQIVSLRVGEALLFSPSAVIGMAVRKDGAVTVERLGAEYLTVKIRDRLTTDGGRSVIA